MARKREEKVRSKPRLVVKVTLEDAKHEELPELVIYAFDRTGKFLDSAPFPKRAEGEVKLSLPGAVKGNTVRVLVGPPAGEETEETPPWLDAMLKRRDKEEKAPFMSLLLRKGAYEKRVVIREREQTLGLVLFPDTWKKYLFCRCVVRGRVVKRVALPDGTSEDLGVCYSCVRIYEVDKFPRFIARLPDRDLFRLRDHLRDLLERRIPEPPPKELPPELKPKVWPPPPPPPPEYLERAGPEFTKETPFHSIETHSMKSLAKGDRGGLQTLSGPIASPGAVKSEMESVFLAGSATQLRNAFVARKDMLVQLVCVWDWLHHYFHSDFIKCVCTDEQGRFETTIWYPCGGDKPDLYFKVLQCIGGSLHTLYDPGVACHTFWNYQCGKEVVLEVSDPAARTCVPPLPVNPPEDVTRWIMPYAVGNTRIDTISTDGLTNYVDGNGLSWDNAPFGGTLGFRLGYSSDIPLAGANLPRYSRWLYRKETQTKWHEFAEPVAATVVRHYVVYDLAHPEKPPTFPVYPLGPKSVNGMHLYEFKPHTPPEPPGHKTEWPVDDWFADIYSAILRSVNLPGGVDNATGKYEIKIEIYDETGNLIPHGAGVFQFIVPDGFESDGVTVKARVATASEIDAGGFVFVLHVDNRKCTASIDAPTIGTVSAGDECGFLRYAPGDLVNVTFHAIHPDNYALFSFWIKRAAHALYPAYRSEVKAPIAGVYTGDGNGNFEKDFTAAALLGPCSEAAFAEILRVYAKATNGWRRLDQYDAHDERAFALAVSE